MNQNRNCRDVLTANLAILGCICAWGIADQLAIAVAQTRPADSSAGQNQALIEAARSDTEKLRAIGEAEGTLDAPAKGVGIQGAAHELFIPKAIGRREIERFGLIMNLSEMQQGLLEALFQGYQEQESRIRKDEINALWERSAANVAMGSASRDPRIAADLALVMRDRDRVVTKLVAIEESLFSGLQPVLAESQWPLLESARQTRIRDRCTLIPRSLYALRGAALDLSSMLYEMNRQGTLEIADRDGLNRLLADYQSTLTYLRDQHFTAYVRSEIEGVQSMSGWPPIPSKSSTGYSQAIDQFNQAYADYHRIWVRPAALQRRINDLNRSYLPLIADTLEANTGLELVRRFREWSYPQVFPNPFDAEPVMRRVMENASTTTEQRSALSAILNAYLDRRDEISDRMVNRVTEWFTRYLKSHAMNHSEFADYQTELTQMQALRRDAAASTLRQVKDIVQAQPDGIGMQMLGDYDKTSQAHKSETIGIDFRP